MTQTQTQTHDKLHIAIIMDGNGRWAKARNLPRPMGHKAGIEAVRRTLKAAQHLPISHLTLYSFSSENWRRPLAEINELMGLLRFYLKSEFATLHKEGVRINVIGEREKLPPDIAEMIREAEEKTALNKSLTLTLALSYGGRQEIASAAQRLAAKVALGEVKVDQITPELFEGYLHTTDLPDPDLVIRTSGEKRISNFLLWQSAYAEYAFLDVLWPDFAEDHLVAAIDDYRQRERRYGTTGETTGESV